MVKLYAVVQLIRVYTKNVREFLVYCLVHLKYYMHLFRSSNSIEIRTLKNMVQGTLQSKVHVSSLTDTSD